MSPTPFHWQTDPNAIPIPLRPIATAPSLTSALSSLGANFSVQLDELGETTSFPYFTDILPPQTLFSRRVTLCLNNTPVVHAQSLCAPSSHWREILDCGTTPLGVILFSGNLALHRSDIEFTTPDGYVLARRSWFDWQGERLYLVECFLENIYAFVQK